MITTRQSNVSNNSEYKIVLTLIVLTSVPLMPIAYADHDTQYYWADEDVEYKCLSGINSILKTGNTSPCPDFSTATNY